MADKTGRASEVAWRIEGATMDAGRIFSLADKVVMVTGASSGLGERMAEVAAANGAKVALVSRRREALEEVRQRITARGGSALVCVADVTDMDAMARAFDETISVLGSVDVFVANAGVGSATLPLDVTPVVWDRTLKTNLDAVFFGGQEAAKRMIAAGTGGSIVTVASIAGFLATLGAPYSVAKAGVIHVTKLLARQLGPHGIRVNCLAPGFIDTNLTHEFLVRSDGNALREKLPLQRFGEPQDIDGAFLLLASAAGSLITGATIVVDSGHSLMG